MQEQMQVPTVSSNDILVFQIDRVVKNEDIEALKQDIRRQIKDGLVVLDGRCRLIACIAQPL